MRLFQNKYTQVIACTFLMIILLSACSREEPRPAPDDDLASCAPQPYAAPAWLAVALIEPGENPLWFELGPDGPQHIRSPQEAGLAPFTPWPHARFVAGIIPWEGFLVMAVNLDGFLVLGPAEDGPAESARAMLRRAADSEFWAPYTVGSFFLWRDQPAALLYRNDFFAALYAHPPRPQVFVLDKSSPAPLGADVPALRQFPPGDNWEAEILRRGPNGYWYYRMREKGTGRNRTAYFRTSDLEGEGVRVSHGAWRDSDLPEGPENIPPLLSALIGDAAMPGGPAFTLRTLSSDFEGMRFFRSAAGENLPRLYAFYREGLALAVLPDGRGLYSRGGDARPFSLPALPQGFAYTGIALLGDIVLATWEEQQGAGIGAAGFMLRNAFL